jgi:hypothetical protein
MTITTGKTFVRVLWDIENIPPSKASKRLPTYDIVQNILNYLKANQIIPSNQSTDSTTGVRSSCDVNVTVFYSPEKRTLSAKDTKSLDRASVEQIFVTSKREDADRKLITRISREMVVLPPESTKFVVISSDLDFVSHVSHNL